MPHSLFLIVGDSLETAIAYNRFMPPESVRLMLVDTFKDEVEESIRLASAQETGLEAVRLDTPSERGGSDTRTGQRAAGQTGSGRA